MSSIFSPEMAAYLHSQENEIDALYASFSEQLNNSYLNEPDYVAPKLTARQRLRVITWRTRGILAAPFAWVVKVLDPSRFNQGDD